MFIVLEQLEKSFKKLKEYIDEYRTEYIPIQLVRKVENDKTIYEIQCDTPIEDIVNLIKNKKKEVVLVEEDTYFYPHMTSNYKGEHYYFSTLNVRDISSTIHISKQENEETYSWEVESISTMRVHVNGKNVIKQTSIEQGGYTLFDFLADITVPTKTSDLTNDSDFISATDAHTYVDTAIANIPSGGGSSTSIDDTAGAGDTTVTWSADKITSELANIESAKSVSVSGANPVIVANDNTRYICGELQTLSFTPCANGICEVIFTSGSSETVLTLPNTVKTPAWFDPTNLDANRIYDISIIDGVYGAVMSW